MGTKRKYTKEAVEEAVRGASSLAEVIRKMGTKPSGGSYRLLGARIREYGIDVSHMTGQGWSAGKTAATSKGVARVAAYNSMSDDEIFIRNSSCTNGTRLRARLLRLGWKYECAICGMGPVWCGEPLTLHIDHINGVTADNRKKNLRFICPNCHQQTKTWGNRKRG